MEIFKTEKITINFGGLIAVDQVSMSLNCGEILGIIGPNGSGKTTFFNLITGIYSPTKGEMFFHNENITGLTPEGIVKKRIYRTFQNTRLFWNLSVLDNVILGMHRLKPYNWFNSMFRRGYTAKELRRDAEEATGILYNFAGNDIMSKLYQAVKDLSQADKKRVEICRALAGKPKLLLLDEPAAGMNPEETENLMIEIKNLKKNNDSDAEIDIIIIEHDMKVIKGLTTKIICLDYGKKIFEGTFEEASKHKEVLKAYLGGEI